MAFFPGTPHRAGKMEIWPEPGQQVAIDPGAQFLNGDCLAENDLIHPLQIRRIVKVEVPIWVPEEAVGEFDYAGCRAVQLSEVRGDEGTATRASLVPGSAAIGEPCRHDNEHNRWRAG